MLHRLIERLPEKVAALYGACDPEKLRLYILKHGSIGISDLLYDMGLIVASAVQDTAVGRGHLNHGHIEILPEGVCRESGLSECISAVDKARGVHLCREVNAGLLPEAEEVLIFREFLLSLRKGSIQHVNITGLHQRLFRIQLSVAIPVVALDLPAVCAVAQLDKALALIDGVRRNCPLIERSRKGKGLHRGAGFIAVRNHGVSPKLIPDRLLSRRLQLVLGILT